MTEDDPITADDLHRHIQASIFGRPDRNAERYDLMAAKLHELVDRPSDREIIVAFLENAERRLPPYRSGTGADAWLRGYYRAVKDELAAMETGDAKSNSPR